MKEASSRRSPTDPKPWDYVIVGAGSAGCAAAYALSKSDPRGRILVVEAGGWDRSPAIRVPAGQIHAVKRHDWGFRTSPDQTRNGVEESWLRGRVVGGSSSINGTMYVRGAAADFDRWARQLGNEGADWRAEAVAPLFHDMERSDSASSLRGRAGPLHVREVRSPHLTTVAFMEAAQAAGLPLNADYNGEQQDGVGYAQLTQRGGLRCSAADAFLRPALRGGRVTVLTGATVLRVKLKGGRATGVVLRRQGVVREIAAHRVILCAGAIGSPQILMLSGVGDATELARHGVRSLVDLPGVGANLCEHPLVRLTYRTRIPSYNLTCGLSQKLSIALKYVLTREGPISNIFEAAAFLRSSDDRPEPDIQLHFMPIGYVKGADGLYGFAPYSSVTVLLNKSYPVSRGRISLASADPLQPPLIDANLLGEPADVATLAAGVEVVRRIMRAEPMASLVEAETVPGPEVTAATALEAFLRESTGIAFHPAGTCRMGIDDGAVVGPDLKVRGVQNLWVGDASIMPDLVSGNTNAACMMIGMKLGRQLGAAGALTQDQEA